MKNIVNNLTSGEISPLLWNRTDLKAYYNACKELKNFVGLPFGGITRRPAIKYIASSKYPAKKSVLINFIYSIDDSYRLEFGDGYIRFFRNGGQILDSLNAIYEITSPYLEANLPYLKFVQKADTMFIVDGVHFPQRLSRFGHDSWTIMNDDIASGPFLDENKTDTTITPTSSTKLTTVGAAITASHTATGSSPNYVFDGIKTGENGWNSGQATTEWLEIELANPAIITRLNIWPLVKRVNTRIELKKFHIEAYIGSAWTKLPIIQWLGNCEEIDTDEAQTISTDYVGQWCEVTVTNTNNVTKYRIVCDTCWGNYIGIKEIELYTDGNADTLTASEAIFNENMVGSLFRIIHSRADNAINGTLTSVNIYSDSVSVTKGKAWEFSTQGNWIATIEIQRSYDNGATWTMLRSYARESSNIGTTGTETDDNALYRVAVVAGAAGAGIDYEFITYDYYTKGIVRITGFVSPTVVTVQTLVALGGSIATKKWSEGSWGDYRGYPRAIAFYGGRLWYGSTTNQPNVLYGSVIGDYSDFEDTGLDDGAVIRLLVEAGQNRIEWLYGETSLMVGTNGEILVVSGDDNKNITPGNIKCRKHLGYGSHHLGAQLLGDVLLFVQRQGNQESSGRKVRAMSYDFAKDKFLGEDFSRWWTHLAQVGILRMAVQNNPEPILWMVLNDGRLATMIFDSAEHIIGWQQHDTDGLFEDVCVGPGEYEDEVWFVVNRTIGGSTVRYVEQLQRFNTELNAEDRPCLDCMLSYDSTPITEVTNLDHLNGESVGVWVDGVDAGTFTVENNKITLEQASSVIHVGLRYDSVVWPVNPATPNADSPLWGSQKIVYTIGISFYNSYHKCNYGRSLTSFYPIPFLITETMTSETTILPFEGVWDDQADVILQTDSSGPLTITAITTYFRTQDGR